MIVHSFFHELFSKAIPISVVVFVCCQIKIIIDCCAKERFKNRTLLHSVATVEIQ